MMSPACRISVGANIVLATLAGVLAWRDRPQPSRADPVTLASTAAETRAQSAKSAAVSRDPGEAHARERMEEANEPRLDPQTIARFEAKGVSRGFLIEVLRQDFNRRWNQRVVALEKKYHPRPPPERAFIELERLRKAEQIRELQAALGEQGYAAWDREETLLQFNSIGVPMNPAEADQAYRLQKQFDVKVRELQMAMEDGVADQADVAALQSQANDAYEKEVEKLLGRRRYEQLRGMADSPVADLPLLADVDLSADQAEVITAAEAEYRARATALAQRAAQQPSDLSAISAELQVLQAAREENFRQALGADAYEKLTRERDTTYQSLRQYAEAWELQADDVEPVYDALKAFHEQAERVREAARIKEAAGHTVDWSAVDADIEQARQRTESGLAGLVGGERLRRMKQNGLLTHR